MSLLIAGIVLWIGTHLSPAILPGTRSRLQQKMGENRYRGSFSLVIIASLVAIVIGWRSTTPVAVYSPPLAAGLVTSLMILAGLILFFAAQVPGNIKRVIRHPQMTGTVLWGAAHLLTNGDSRSIALFSSLTAWAMIEIVLINRRDGKVQRPGIAAIKFDLIPFVIGLAAFAALALFHATLFGVPAIPG